MKDSGINSTSKVRPFLRFSTALCVYTMASGRVHTFVHDSGITGIWLDDGIRDVPDCLIQSFSGVFSAFTRDLCVIFRFYEVLCNNLYCHRLLVTSNVKFSRLSGRSPFKKKHRPTQIETILYW
jgi:hypothetical protein